MLLASMPLEPLAFKEGLEATLTTAGVDYRAIIDEFGQVSACEERAAGREFLQLFEFLMVLVSIIVGLGIAALLTGLADLLRARRSTSSYWVHSLLIVAIFLALAQVWWESWGLRTTPEWTFVGLLMMLASPVCLFLIAHLLFPASTDTVELEVYYFEVAPVLWMLGALATMVGTLFRPVVFDEALFSIGNLATVPTLGICLVLASTGNKRVHSLLVPALVLLILLDTILINRALG